MTRSTLSRPVGLSSSYFRLEPRGISMTATKSRGTSLPGKTSCQGCTMMDRPRGERATKYYQRERATREAKCRAEKSRAEPEGARNAAWLRPALCGSGAAYLEEADAAARITRWVEEF